MGSPNELTLLSRNISKAFGIQPLADIHSIRYCGVCKKKLLHKRSELNQRKLWVCYGMNHETNLWNKLELIKQKNEINALNEKYESELKKDISNEKL